MNNDIHNTVTGGVFLSTVIQGRDITVVLPPQIFPAMTGLPPTTPTFTGRDSDLTALLDTLAPVEKTVRTAAVGGMGGVGKTELALQAARIALARGWFPGGILFTDMRGYDPDAAVRREPGQALEGLLRAVGVPGEHIPADVQDRSRLLRSVLATYAAQGRRVLVVVDNVSAGTQALPLLPSDGDCAAIVTSRHVLADLDARLLNLDTLPAGQATDLFDKALRLRDPADSRVGDQPDDAARLADLCAGLPLALQIVAAQLAANPAKPLAVMTAALDDAASRLEGMTFADRAVRAVFDSSYHQLGEAEARLFRLLSLNPGPDIATAAAASLTDLAEGEAGRGLEALAQAHLIEPGVTYGRWRVHDLLRLHSARHGDVQAEPDRRDQALSRLLEYYLTTTAAANAHIDPRVTDPARLGFPDQAQAMDWLDTEYPNLTAAVAAAADHPAIARDLPQAMWHFLRRRRHLNDWVALSGTAVDAARTLADRDAEATALNGLGSALQTMRRYEEAITAHTDAVELYREVGNRHGEGKALINLGAALEQNRLSDRAATVLTSAVETFQRAGDLLHQAMALQNLGIVQRTIRRFVEAAANHTEAVRIYRELGDRHGEAMALDSLGSALGKARRFAEAVAAHDAAVRLYRDTGDRHGESSAVHNLGIALRQAGQFDQAITVHQDAIVICRELGDRFYEAAALHGLGMALHQVRRFDEAAVACQDAARLFGALGDDHNKTLALEDLRRAREAQGAASSRWWRRPRPEVREEP